jgi:hypothetical protein
MIVNGESDEQKILNQPLYPEFNPGELVDRKEK